MTGKIDRIKAELREALKEELSGETVKVTFTLNSYGFYTQIEERSAESLELHGESMRNIHGNWIK